MVVKIDGLDSFGRGVCRIDNKVCFIPNALSGEVVDVEIVKSGKKYDLGKVIKYLKTSCTREEVKCPIYDECGGCNLLHTTYSNELDFKKGKVKELVDKFSHINNDLVSEVNSFVEFNYRNKVVFHVKDRKLGFFKEKSNEICTLDNCMLLRSEINELIPYLKEFVEDKSNDIRKIMVRVSNRVTDKSSIMISIDGVVKNLSVIEKKVGVIYVNGKCMTKDSKIISSIGDCKFYISPESFFQVNDYVVSKLYDEVLNFCISNKPHKVLDLYCGTGTIGIYISKYVDEVLGIDSQDSSIRDANENKLLNNVNNIKFICSRVEDIIDSIKGNYDLIVVDPPRAGLDFKTIKYLEEIAPKNIIYISCDPATLSRDLNLLNDKYEVKSIKPFNMFSKTYHVESVTLLCRKN